MAASCTLAIDAMSGDFGPHVIVPTSLDFLSRFDDCRLLLVGDENLLRSQIDQQSKHFDVSQFDLDIVHAEQIVAMDDKPSVALRQRRESSMYKAIELVADGKANACVSAGNTGALMAMGRYRLGMHPGIDRPAIATMLPTRTGHCHMLDLGANVDCSANHLLQFALMGSVLVETLENKPSPSIGLLNVGSEETKGNEQVKLASCLLQEQSRLNYIGYIEGDDIYAGKADVVVCDGFVGNVVLKSSEGVARLIKSSLEDIFHRSLYRKFLGLLIKPALKDLHEFIDPSHRNGASLLGLRGIVVKSHGSADRLCFGHAIAQARSEVVEGLSGRIGDKLATLL